MRASTNLLGLTATTLASGTVISTDAVTAGEVKLKTATSPDGYIYRVEEETYVEDTITTADGITHTVFVHPKFKRSVDEHGTCPNPNKNKRLSYHQGSGDQCDGTTLIDMTSNGSPTVGGCAVIRDFYLTANGYFNAGPIEAGGDAWLRLVTAGTCVFSIKTKHDRYRSTLSGSSNIVDLVDVSNNCQSGSRVGAEGQTVCVGFVKTQWAIFHA